MLGVFSPTWDFPALSPRQPLTRADISTHPLSPTPLTHKCHPSNSSYKLVMLRRTRDLHHGVEFAGSQRQQRPWYVVPAWSQSTKVVAVWPGRCKDIWPQTNTHQCQSCCSVPNSQILYCKCGKGFQLNHNRATWGVSDATAHLEWTALSRRHRERLKQGLWSWSCCNLPETMTMPNSDLLHPLHHPAIKNFVTPVTFKSLLKFTCSKCHRVIKKSSPSATCTNCGQSRHLACNYLPRRERESIHDGCQEWRCCGTAQSPSTSTMPSQNHPTPSQISESTMSQEMPIYTWIHTQPIPQKKSEATNWLLEGDPCSDYTTQIRQGARRLACWPSKAQYHINCIMSNHTQTMRTQTTQRWQCNHCQQTISQKTLPTDGCSNRRSILFLKVWSGR